MLFNTPNLVLQHQDPLRMPQIIRCPGEKSQLDLPAQLDDLFLDCYQSQDLLPALHVFPVLLDVLRI